MEKTLITRVVGGMKRTYVDAELDAALGAAALDGGAGLAAEGLADVGGHPPQLGVGAVGVRRADGHHVRRIGAQRTGEGQPLRVDVSAKEIHRRISTCLQYRKQRRPIFHQPTQRDFTLKDNLSNSSLNQWWSVMFENTSYHTCSTLASQRNHPSSIIILYS